MKALFRSGSPYRNRQHESGVFIVLVAILVVTLAALVGLVLATGFISTSKARIQNAANLAALAAVEEFFRDESSSTPDQRAEKALARAREVMSNNYLLGGQSDATAGELGLPPNIGEASTAPGGTLRFGIWHQEAPLDLSDPCFAAYPCFIEVSSPTSWVNPPFPVVNAVRLEAKAQSPIVAPLAAFLGQSGEFGMSAQASAAVVPRCTVFLLDASLSTTNDSHPSKIRGEKLVPSLTGHVNGTPDMCSPLDSSELFFPPRRYFCPRNIGLFAYNDWISYDRSSASEVPAEDFLDPQTVDNPCRSDSFIYNSNDVQPGVTKEGYLWCNSIVERLGPLGVSLPVPPISPRMWTYPNGSSGWRSLCYEFERTPYGRMLIDKCDDPLPLSDFLLGFNAGVRMLERQRTAADRVRMNIFRGAGTVEPYPKLPDIFTSDPSVMVQLTNGLNRGVINSPYALGSTPTYRDPEVHPNFIDQGWFPIMQRGGLPNNILEVGTNISGAVKGAMDALADTTQCPSGAQKSIIIATDGVSTCYEDAGGPTCGTAFSFFQNAESQLLSGASSILSQLKQRKIAVTSLFAGSDAQPHLIDRMSNGNFLSYKEAVSVGYRGLTDLGGGVFSGNPATDPQLLIDSRPSCSGFPGNICPGATEADKDAYAFQNLDGTQGTVFRRAGGVLAHLSIETGGIFCPLLPAGNDSQYEDHDSDTTTPDRLKDSERSEGGIRYIADFKVSPGEVAADCVRQTLGGNPYSLVSE